MSLSSLIAQAAKSSTKEVKKTWGKEVWLVNEPEYCCKLLFLDRGAQSSYHYHRIKKETFFVLTGEIALTIGKKDQLLRYDLGSRVINPGVLHGFYGSTDAVILEVSTHHDDKDVVRETESRRGYASN